MPPIVNLNIKLSSCFGWGGDRQKREFLRLHELIKKSDCSLVDSFSNADVILVTDIHHRNSYRYILSIPEHKQYYEKLVCYSEMDFPPDKIPGIYSSCSNKKEASRGAGYYFHWKDILDRRFGGDPSDVEVGLDRNYLVSYMGRCCNQVRENVLQLADQFNGDGALFEDTSKSFPLFQGRVGAENDMKESRKQYLQVLSDSRFVLCPRGAGLSSIRLFECLKYGAVPVIISDELKLPNDSDWDRCSLRVSEADIDSIPDLLRERANDFPRLSKAAQDVYQDYFRDRNYWKYIESALCDISSSPDIEKRSPLLSIYWNMYLRDVERNLVRIKRQLKLRLALQ